MTLNLKPQAQRLFTSEWMRGTQRHRRLRVRRRIRWSSLCVVRLRSYPHHRQCRWNTALGSVHGKSCSHRSGRLVTLWPQRGHFRSDPNIADANVVIAHAATAHRDHEGSLIETAMNTRNMARGAK